MGEKNIPACIDQMTVKQMRIELEYGRFGEQGSPSHNFVSRWLSIKEAEERDRRDNESLNIAKEANFIAREAATAARRSARWAIIAAIMAAIASIITIKPEIMWAIKYLIQCYKIP